MKLYKAVGRDVFVIYHGDCIYSVNCGNGWHGANSSLALKAIQQGALKLIGNNFRQL